MRYGDLRKITPPITRFEGQDQRNWSKMCEAVPLTKQAEMKRSYLSCIQYTDHLVGQLIVSGNVRWPQRFCVGTPALVRAQSRAWLVQHPPATLVTFRDSVAVAVAFKLMSTKRQYRWTNRCAHRTGWAQAEQSLRGYHDHLLGRSRLQAGRALRLPVCPKLARTEIKHSNPPLPSIRSRGH